jgi:hypothetical protein
MDGLDFEQSDYFREETLSEVNSCQGDTAAPRRPGSDKEAAARLLRRDMDPYEWQNKTAGTWATMVWIGSGLFLYLTTKDASLLSWSALVFFVVGMFAAATIFGVGFYLLQRGIGKALVKVVKTPTPSVATAVRAIGLVLLIIETVIIYVAASWVFHAIT